MQKKEEEVQEKEKDMKEKIEKITKKLLELGLTGEEIEEIMEKHN